MTDPTEWKPLTPAFKAALRRYDRAATQRLLAAEKHNAVTAQLFHYTNREGLRGIIQDEQIWFTHYQHLNDDRESAFGMEIAKASLADSGEHWPKAKIFCDLVADLFSSDNLNSAFEFYISSFTLSRDDVHQWNNYAEHGQGFAISLAPRLFGIEPDRTGKTPDQIAFVSPVVYGDAAGRALHRPAIESAVRIAAETAEHKKVAMKDRNRGLPFFRDLANRLLATELILNCLALKGLRWKPEREVRLFILGECATLEPYVSKRSRGEETVPFMKHRMSLCEPGSNTEILIGPAAPPDAEDFACSLLAPFHENPRSIVRRSASV